MPIKSPAISIRPATPVQYDRLVEMSLALYSEDPSEHRVEAVQVTRTLKHFAAHPDCGQAFLVWVDGIAVGYSLLVFFWSNEWGGNIAIIDELYVSVEARGRGVGSAILLWLENYRPGGAVALALETTPTNARAKGLYERHGFKGKKNFHLIRKL